MLHPTLERQLQRLGLSGAVSPLPEAWSALLEEMGAAYAGFENAGRAARAELSAEHDRLQAVFTSLADAVCVLDRELRCQLLNPAAERLLGVSVDEARGRSLGEFVRGIDVVTRKVTGSARVDDTRLERRDGRSIPVSLVVAPIWSDDAVQGIVVVLRDVTARQQLELELHQAQKLESVGRLASGIAHEINTPVQFVSDSVSFLRDAMGEMTRLVASYRVSNRSILDGSPSLDSARAAERVEEEADLDYVLANVPKALERSLDGLGRVAAIVRSMKEFAHPDQKEMTPIDLNQAIRSTLTIARNEYKYVADVETDLAELPSVTCHGGEINQVVLNIVVNAAHAIGDVVRGTEKKGRIKVSTRHDGNAVVIAIGDTGNGIPEAIRDRIFDPFFTTKGVGKGTGQGLAIARSVVVEKHGGELTFVSTLGEGTTFFIRIPIAGIRETVPA